MPETCHQSRDILADELAELGVSASELARQIDVPVNRVTQILQGKRSISADTALRFGHWFGTSADFWLNLQTAHDLRVARDKLGEEVARLPIGSETLRLEQPVESRNDVSVIFREIGK